MNYFLVFLGGGLGSITRFGVSRIFISAPTSVPVATLISNIISSGILGLLFGFYFHKQFSQDSMRLLIATGFCGGFSTFSTFSYENFMLISAGNYKTGIINILANIFFTYAAVAAGFFISKFL